MFTLAKLRLAEPATPKSAAGSKIVLGDTYRGETIFQRTCASCHGRDGGGGIGPRLRGSKIELTLVRERIRNGKGVMPAGLVSGQQERDVLAYVATLIAPASSSASN